MKILDLDQTDVQSIESELRTIAQREIALSVEIKTADGAVARDGVQRQIESGRQRRVSLLAQRNRALASEARAKAAALRQQAEQLRNKAMPHISALVAMGYSIAEENQPDRLLREADSLDREARQLEGQQPRAGGNVRARSLQELLQMVFSELAILPTIDDVVTWAEGGERQRFGGLQPDIQREYQLIWRGGCIDPAASRVYWASEEAAA